MEVVDYIIVSIILLSALVSFARGFIREAMSMLGLIAACCVALFGAKYLAPHLVEQLANPQLRFWAAAAMLFVGTLFAAAVVNYLLGKFLLSIGVNGTDRLLGILLGAARGVVLVALFIIVSNVLALPIKQWWPESKFLGEFDELTAMISGGATNAYDTWKAEQGITPDAPPVQPSSQSNMSGQSTKPPAGPSTEKTAGETGADSSTAQAASGKEIQ
jgi:membrane protein required for colicin V production